MVRPSLDWIALRSPSTTEEILRNRPLGRMP